MSGHKCQKCGVCCQVGTIWVWSKHPIIQAIGDSIHQESPEYLADTGRCAMLNNDNECLIEKYLGREFKPQPCRDYPEDGEKCHRESENL